MVFAIDLGVRKRTWGTTVKESAGVGMRSSAMAHKSVIVGDSNDREKVRG